MARSSARSNGGAAVSGYCGLSAVLFTDSWFEDTGETRGIIQGARSARTAEKRIWAFLEGRRDIWARRFLQTAIILKSAKKERMSKALAAAAFALMHKHPLEDIPLVEDIVMTTPDAGGGSRAADCPCESRP